MRITALTILMLSILWMACSARLSIERKQTRMAQWIDPASPNYKLACPIADEKICAATMRQENARRQK